MMIEPNHREISIRRQCELIGLNRASYYYEPAGAWEFNLHLMRLIDEQYLKTPFYGWRRMRTYLGREGYLVNHKRVKRLMQVMGLQAIYAKRAVGRVAIADDLSHGLAGYLCETREEGRQARGQSLSVSAWGVGD